MSGQWRSSTRRRRLPANWSALRAKRLRQDSHRCVICGNPAVDVDHIARGDDHRLGNLQSLCAPHHREKTQREAQQASATQRARLKLPAERHPGAI